MLNITENHIKIGASKPFTLLHITDLHLSRCDSRDGEYENANAVDRTDCFPSANEHYAEIMTLLGERKPDITAFTGDIIDFPSERNFDELNKLTAACGNYVYTPGNHDWSYPRAYHKPETYAKYMHRFNRYCGGDTMFGVREFNGVLFICVDDSRDRVDERQLELFREQVGRGMPMIVFLHVPIYTEPLIEKVIRIWRSPIVIGHSGSDEVTKRFREEVIGSGATVMTGHVHFDREDKIESCEQFITAHAAEGSVRLLTVE